MRLRAEVSRGPATMAAELREGGIEILDELAPAWRGLCAEGPCDEPFHRPEWVRAWVDAFAPAARLVVATAWAGGRLRAVLPLVAARGFYAGLPVRILRSAANVHSCRSDIVHGVRDRQEAVAAIWSALAARGGFDALELQDVPDGGAAFDLQKAAEDDGHATGTQVSLRSPYIQLSPSFDTVMGRTDAKFRANLRRRRRKLESKGKVELKRVTTFDPSLLDRFFALEQAGWKGGEGTAIACDAATRRFYESVARAGAEAGWLSMYALTCGGEDVAIHFGATWKGRYFVPKPAYHEGHRECSPGQLIVEGILQDCVGRGLREFDFLGPMMEWKADWAPQVREHSFVWIFRAGAFGRVLHVAKFRVEAALRSAGKRLLKGRA